MELGGILVYDAFARIEGSQRILDYYAQHKYVKPSPHILFNKETHE